MVIFSSLVVVEKLVESWPWIHRAPPSNHEHIGNEILKDAFKFGLRTLRKQTWETLQAEYIAYRQVLIHNVAEVGDNSISLRSDDDPSGMEDNPQCYQPLSSDLTAIPLATTLASYPHGCLVFVRNVHPETNKSALRKLLTAALRSCQTSDDGIDYVDYNKGMDNVSIYLHSK
jgi:hypothetical protein